MENGKEPKQRVCLYFGSFNPIHTGHISLATYALDVLSFDEVWLVLSPLNPHKSKHDQLPFDFRARLIESALSANPALHLCLYEHDLPLPHYTVRTLRALELMYPDNRFSLLIGGDNLVRIASWYQYERLLERIPIYVYPRPNTPEAEDFAQTLLRQGKGDIRYCTNVPLLPISSTELRLAALQGKDLSQYLPDQKLWTEFAEQIKFRRGRTFEYP